MEGGWRDSDVLSMPCARKHCALSFDRMPMVFEELDDITRRYMLEEFEVEQASGNPYVPKILSPAGVAAFPNFMRAAIKTGNEQTLIASLAQARYWNATEAYVRNGVVRQREINVNQAAERLGLTEFNTWYVRGLAKRMIDDGMKDCEVYRAAQPKWEPAECSEHEGRIYPVADIYEGHRRRYWPEPGNPSALSIPAGPSCHHAIRRVRAGSGITSG